MRVELVRIGNSRGIRISANSKKTVYGTKQWMYGGVEPMDENSKHSIREEQSVLGRPHLRVSFDIN